MEWKKEILSNLVAVFALGFFLIPAYGYYYSGNWEENMYLYTLLAFLSLFMAVILAIFLKSKGLETEGTKMRKKWLEEGTPIFLVPFGYGLCLVLVIMAIFIFIQSGRIDILIGLIIFALFLFLIFRYAKKEYESKHKRQETPLRTGFRGLDWEGVLDK